MRIHVALLLLAMSSPLAHAAAPTSSDDAFARGYADYRADNYAGALEHWRALAEAGHAKAQYGLGLMYASGQGVEKDEAQAVQWLRRAADQSEANAQLNLAVMYANGRGVAQDYGQAVQWCEKAAAQGNAQAQTMLGQLYSRGQGVAPCLLYTSPSPRDS